MLENNKLKRYFLNCLHNSGFAIRQITVSPREKNNRPIKVPYQENPEAGPENLKVKLSRVAAGGSFEWPNIIALNKAVANLAGDATKVVELGGGTGCFAYEISKNHQIVIVSSEFDRDASAWAKENRNRPNISYVSRPVSPEEGPFDLVVSIEVIEHISDFRGFIETCISLAPKGIYTTPNKNRTPASAEANPPVYYQHVREWTSGEFYWVLRSFYQDVKLYAMPDPFIPFYIPVEVTTQITPLIAVCDKPY